MKRGILGSLGCGLMLLAVAGCSSESGKDADEKPVVTSQDVLEVFSWWTSPGEAEALQALVDTYKLDYPSARVSLSTDANASTWSQVLGSGIEDSPWDVFQLNASDLAPFVAAHPGAVAPVDEFYDDPSVSDAVLPELREAVTIDGTAYGVLVGAHRNNTLFYNQQIFADHGQEPPTTIEEFMQVCAALKADGVTPLAMAFAPWTLRQAFDVILAGEVGAERFQGLVTHEISAADIEPELTAAIDHFDTILHDYIDYDTSSAEDYDWADATQSLHDGDAAMLILGDFAKGYLISLGWTPGVDFGTTGGPGASDLFVFGPDMFGLPTTAPHDRNAKEFLSVLLSKEGQVAFNRYKGSTPARIDVRDDLDETGKATLDDMVNAKVLSRGHEGRWDAGLVEFAQDFDKAALLKFYLDTP